jgi:hypothetical protein
MAPSALVRIGRILRNVRAAKEAAEAGQSVQCYQDAYLALVNDVQTIDAVELYLKDTNYQNDAVKIRDLYAMVCGVTMGVAEIKTYGDSHDSPYFFAVSKRPWADVRPELLQWLCKLEQALLKARNAVLAVLVDDDGSWSKPDGPAQWAKAFGISWDTLKRRIKDGKIRCKKLSTKSYSIHVDDLPKS